MGIRINGTLEPIRSSTRTRFDPSKGFVVSETWQSAGDNLSGLATAAQTAEQEYEHEANQLKSRLTITSTGAAAGLPDTTTDTWQLLANQIQRDVKDHPNVLAFPLSGNGSLSQTIRFTEDFRTGTPPPDPDPPDGSGDLGGFYSARQFFLYRLLIHGVTSYTVDQHVVRHTLNVPLKYAGAITYSVIPGLMTTVLDGLVINGPNDGVQFKWGWKRTGYQYTVGANNRVEVTTEWALASWSLLLYAAGAILAAPG